MPEFTSSHPRPQVRRLKIESDGDFWKGLTKPKIRLAGHWLERAGFKPGHHVQVTCVAPGVIELRSPRTVPASETTTTQSEPSERSP